MSARETKRDFRKLTDSVLDNLAQGKAVRRKIPGGGEIHIERALPFLCVYRLPNQSDSGMRRLMSGSPSRICVASKASLQKSTSLFIEEIAFYLKETFGTALILEIRSGKENMPEEPISQQDLIPEFRISSSTASEDVAVLFQHALSLVKSGRNRAAVELILGRGIRTGGALPPLLSSRRTAAAGIHLIGIELSPFFRDIPNQDIYPKVFRLFSRQLNMALQKALYAFTSKFTTHKPLHYHELGRRAVSRTVMKVDHQLAEISDNLEVLLNVTPVNSDQAWRTFKKSKYSKRPLFHYRPISVDAVESKRALYKTPVERIEDPAMASLFRGKLFELDCEITLLQERGTPRFMHESLQIYGAVDDRLLAMAYKIIDKKPDKKRRGEESFSSTQFAALARDEFSRFQQIIPASDMVIDIRDDVAGVLVSKERLILKGNIRIPHWRINALLQHEVGTHVLTRLNGCEQSLEIMHSGLAGYEGFQEGLAVLAEYLVGGLTVDRLRLLASRVVAVKWMTEGAEFVECFNRLKTTYHFSAKVAFTITLRIYRGGGYVKDAVYLRGLCQVFEYLQKGGDLETLYIGKIALEQIPIIKELLWREILTPPKLLPSFLNDPTVVEKIKKIRLGLTIPDLLTEGD